MQLMSKINFCLVLIGVWQLNLYIWLDKDKNEERYNSTKYLQRKKKILHEAKTCLLVLLGLNWHGSRRTRRPSISHTWKQCLTFLHCAFSDVSKEIFLNLKIKKGFSKKRETGMDPEGPGGHAYPTLGNNVWLFSTVHFQMCLKIVFSILKGF